MASTPINALDEITLPFGATEVWPVLTDIGAYPNWWPRSLHIRVLPNPVALTGTEVEIRPAGGRPFQCRVEAVEALQTMRMRYFGGFIEGIGEWRLEPCGAHTRVSYRLEAHAHGWLVVLLGKVLDLAGLHSRAMQAVLQNLGQVLEQQQRPARPLTSP